MFYNLITLSIKILIDLTFKYLIIVFKTHHSFQIFNFSFNNNLFITSIEKVYFLYSKILSVFHKEKKVLFLSDFSGRIIKCISLKNLYKSVDYFLVFKSK